MSETRDVLNARLPHVDNEAHRGLSDDALALVTSIAGEVGNNSFDHNLGLWRDVPGCWFETQVTGGRLWICVADRGQGIFRSLANVLPDLRDDQAALDVAFNQRVTGRAPEPRGNGLKFVKSIVTGAPGRGLACASGNGMFEIGDLGPTAAKLLRTNARPVKGTITLLLWELT